MILRDLADMKATESKGERKIEYLTFVEKLKNHILENEEWNISKENYKFYPDGYIAETDIEKEFIHNTNVKYNRVESDTLIGDFLDLTVSLEGRTDTYCRFSVKNLYNEYQEYGWERVDFIISENIKLAVFYDIDEIMENLTNYAIIHNRLIVRPINFTDNKYELKDCVYKRIGDIALVLYVLLYDDDEMGLGTLKVRKGFADKWKKDYSKIWEEALLNTNVWAPPRMYMHAMDLIDPPYTQGAFMSLGYKFEKINPLSAPTITTVKKKNGAIAMFYPGVLEKLAEICDGSYYVSFTSIHDVRIHPISTVQPRQILRSLKNVNKMFNQPSDILSRQIFIYDFEKKNLTPIEM